MRRWLILHETGFTRWRFFTSYFNLSTVECSSGYIVFISYSTICFWIDLVRVLATTGNTSAIAGYTLACIITRKFKGLDSREIISLPEMKNVMRTWRVISIIAKNKPRSHHKTHLHTMKVTITIEVLPLFLFDHWSERQFKQYSFHNSSNIHLMIRAIFIRWFQQNSFDDTRGLSSILGKKAWVLSTKLQNSVKRGIGRLHTTFTSCQNAACSIEFFFWG